ncbi:hypothetical protein BGX21_001070 [Mortierella sp. AD011]|nr:hypothetical protein BGX20_008326 [Mortierella sp. AD010]KAF9385409.1 hypothetical protein BGX21_001070 [Mortierella sp. AD011]
MNRKLTNPLDITWIRSKIAQYVTLRDALSCILVCKDWFEDFIPSIWHTIDFKTQEKFTRLASEVISEHGHHIRVIKNLQSSLQLQCIQNSKVCKLRDLSIVVGSKPHYSAHCYDIMRRNNASLTSIRVSASQGSNTDMYFSIDPLFMGLSSSKLTYIKADSLTMTRDAFSSMLRMTPLLNTIDVRNTTLSSIPSTEIYQHPNVTTLVSPIKQVFSVDPQVPDSPSILRHFPNIAFWRTWDARTNNARTALDVSAHTIESEISQNCPLLVGIDTEYVGAHSVDLLTKCFEGLKSICVLHSQFSTELIMAILSHQETLESVSTYTMSDGIYESGEIPNINNHFQEKDWVIQMIPRSCSRLTSFKFMYHQMNMCDIGSSRWSCVELEYLHTRIAGLDTKEKINRAIQLWVEGRSRVKEVSTAPTTDHYGLPLEERVARHLLKFKKLKEVWLGTEIRRVG